MISMTLRDILMKFKDTVRFRIIDYATDKILYASYPKQISIGKYSIATDELLDANVETIDFVCYGFDAWVEFYIRWSSIFDVVEDIPNEDS